MKVWNVRGYFVCAMRSVMRDITPAACLMCTSMSMSVRNVCLVCKGKSSGVSGLGPSCAWVLCGPLFVVSFRTRNGYATGSPSRFSWRRVMRAAGRSRRAFRVIATVEAGNGRGA